MARTFEGELLERPDELALLGELIAGIDRDTGSFVLVEGPMGIGKSSLLAEAVGCAGDLGFEASYARGSELEREFAFGLVRQLFEPLLARLGPEQRFRAFDGAAALARPLFDELDAASLSPRGEAVPAMLHGLYWLAANLATDHRLALVVDDAHWGDAPSLRFLAYLANRIGGLPVFLAIGVRPAEPGAEVELLDELAATAGTLVLRPAPLSRSAVNELVEMVLGPDPDAGFTAACFDSTAGNPLLVGELLRSLGEDQVVPDASAAQRIPEMTPESVRRTVARRLRQLGADATALARAVAVLGDGTPPATAAELSGLDADSAAEAAEALHAAHVLRGELLEFVHPMVRAAVYSELSPRRRSQQHGAAAAVLAALRADEDAVAVHLLAGEARGDRRTVELLRRTARRAHARGAPDVAAAHLQRALAEPPSSAERADVLVDLAHAELNDGRPAGYERLREALGLTVDPVARAEIALRLARELYKAADFEAAVEVLDEALAELPEDEAGLAETLEAQLISTCLVLPSLRHRVLDRLLTLMMDPSRVSDPVLLVSLANATMSTMPPAASGVALVDRALASGPLSVEDNPSLFVGAGVALMMAGRFDRALELSNGVLSDARHRGSLPALGIACTLRGMVHLRTGALPAAEADARLALETLDPAVTYPLPTVLATLVDALLERGELEKASGLLDRHALGGELSELLPTDLLLHSAGRLRLAQNRVDEGIAHLRECGRRIEEWGVRNPALLAWRSALALALAHDERDEALALAREEIEVARSFEVSRELGIALRAAGVIEGGTAGIELLREAVDVLEPSPARLEHARALTDLGSALRRAGQRSAAREPLRAGLDLALRCGATPLARHAHEELVATGARPRRLLLRGVDALTASERRVAEMVSEGLTNREVAQALFVTEKTVETHLGNAYRKLDINSRSQLPGALSRRGTPAESGPGRSPSRPS
jgi:DNA-binding CsgD family transcriptional regulator